MGARPGVTGASARSRAYVGYGSARSAGEDRSTSGKIGPMIDDSQQWNADMICGQHGRSSWIFSPLIRRSSPRMLSIPSLVAGFTSQHVPSKCSSVVTARDHTRPDHAVAETCAIEDAAE